MPQRPQIAALITGCLATAPAVASDPGWNFSGLGETHLIVSHPTGSGRGAIQIFHDSSSTPIRTIYSPDRRDLFGVAAAGAGDLDGDGFDDVLVGAPLAGRGITNHGMVHAFSAATGLEIMAIPGFGDANYFGRAVASAGDINDDSVPDILVSGWIQSELGVSYGRVYVMCGLDGSVLKTITSFEADDAFGYTIVSLGDLTGDGIPEIAIAAPTAQTNSLGDGAVYIFDLSTRPVKHITTADAAHTIRNDVAEHELFGSVLAYDDLQSTDGYDIVLIGSVDPASYGASPAQFIFSRHRVGYQGVLSTQSTPSITEGDVIPDGKIEDSDVNAVTTNLNQPGTGITTDPDLNGDGIITGSDLVIVLSNYGTVSSLNTMLADPSELVTRVSQLTSADGGLTVEPGIGEPWIQPICEDDDDDIIDGGGGGGGGTRPGIQPGFPGVQPGKHPVIGGGGGPFRSPSLPPTDDGEDCPDDGDDGCSSCAPADAEDCDAFANTDSASFVGRGLQSDLFFANMTSDSWSVQIFPDPSSEVQSSIVSGATSTNGIDYRAIVKFGDEAGVAKLIWMASHRDTGVVVTKCVSVTIVDYEPVRFQYRTFIPCSAVPTPDWATRWPVNLPPFFSGDLDRYTCVGNSGIFGHNPTPGQTHRSSIDTFIVSNGILSTRDSIASLPCNDDEDNYTEGELPDNNIYPRFGSTRSFAASSVIAACDPPGPPDPRCEFKLNANATHLQTATREHVNLQWKQKFHGHPGGGPPICSLTLHHDDLDDGTNGAYSLRTAPNVVKTIYHLHASAPIPFTVMPAIDVHGAILNLTWEVNHSTGNQTIWWTFRGEYDGFPSHEAYLEEEILGRFDPTVAGHGLFHLTPPAPNQRYNSAGSIVK